MADGHEERAGDGSVRLAGHVKEKGVLFKDLYSFGSTLCGYRYGGS